MADDLELVRQIQQRVRNWEFGGKCVFHRTDSSYYWATSRPTSYDSPVVIASPRFQDCCAFDMQERLIELHLCGLDLVQIPSEVWQCSSLERLWLDHNRLRSLSAEVAQLSFLQLLSLRYNKLRSLPAEVGSLSSLVRLWLDGNQFRSLPAEVVQLSYLQSLSLRDNDLHSLPAEVGSLSSLMELCLDNNKLCSLPAEVVQLSYLRCLSLRDNDLHSLPAEVGSLSYLVLLDLHNNPLQEPPPEIIEQDTPAILAYLQTLAAATPAEKTTTNIPLARPISIFYCYAYEDKDLRERLEKHLGVLKRTGQVTGWYDRGIQAGTEWEREIETHLSTASIILLLVSADFVNSDYCYGVEMQKALEMHEKGKARVLPILLRPVYWQGAPFAMLQILPTGAKPITTWQNQDEALKDVAEQISAVVTALRT